MGNSSPKPVPKTVLVPPLFEPSGLHDRDARAGSAYRVAFGQRERFRLFNEMFSTDVSIRSVLRPPGERFDIGVSVIKKDSGIVEPELSVFSAAPASSRFDGSFVRASNGNGALSASGCGMHAPSGAGAFFNITRASPLIGIRWSGSNAGLGIGLGQSGTPTLAWAVGRMKSGLMVGYERSHDRFERAALAYETLMKGARLHATVEVREPRDGAKGELSTSFLYHFAVRRQVQNPLEKESVVGITNYIDVAAEMTTSLHCNELREFKFGAGWQINTNWLVKARMEQSARGGGGMSAVVAFKSWWTPTCTLAFSQHIDFAHPLTPKTGLWFTAENVGSEQYSRAALRNDRGLVREHEASEVEVANAERRGRLQVAPGDESMLEAAEADARRRADGARF